MDSKCNLLVEHGYHIVWMAGNYCRAWRENQDLLLRWDGDHWVVL